MSAESTRAWNAANPEKVLAASRAWKERNSERVRAYSRAYHADHRIDRQVFGQSYRASTAGILAAERGYQKRARGGAAGGI